MTQRAWLFGGLAVLTLLFGWVLVIVLPGWIAPRQSTGIGGASRSGR